MSSRPALVLTAGLGTRLWPLTMVRAKPACPVAGVPLAERILRQLSRQGVSNAVLNLHHLPASLTSRIGDGSQWGLSVRYSWEATLLGSGGGPRHALSLLGSGAWFIVNGDTLCDVALGDLAACHQASGALVTLAVVPRAYPQRYGGVLIDDDDIVTGFVPRGDGRPAWHFVGIQIADAAAFSSLADGAPAETVTGLYSDLVKNVPGAIRAWRTQGRFIDIGSLRDYLDANLTLASAEATAVSAPGAGSRVASGATVSDSVIWDDVEVGDGARLDQCVVTDGVVVPAGSRFSRCVLVRAEAGASLRAACRLADGLVVCPMD
ncbi:MAG: sugar phosphate nucleotidyltransferase [Vicinamibacterales bacterium]